MKNPASLTATAAARAIAGGQLGSEELVRACLDRVAALDGDLRAWAWIEPEQAIAQARDADLARRSGQPLGPLHGVPVGVKDVFDTADMPTEWGTPLHEGRRPQRDATAVALLRRAGAVILGKTACTEFSVYTPGPTRNPHDSRRTPGGSSSGSAAAVAAFMAPLALATQTNGSVIRPASYCGVVGYKPSFGLISRNGVLRQSRSLDQVGVMARTVEDAALLAEALMVYDPHDPDMVPRWRPDLVRVGTREPPLAPRFAFIRTPAWEWAAEGTADIFAQLVADLGAQAQEVALPPAFDTAIPRHRVLMETDLARSYARDYERGADRMSRELAGMIERGREHRAVDYVDAAEGVPALYAQLEEVLEWYDAIITPAAPGEAPLGLESTGSPAFSTLWTLLGLPSITVPILKGPAGMPVGVQVVAGRGDDARLLRAARWLMRR
ncbi:MAG: amidase [Alphaproteobacteria bacterium]|nr:amidase [Alphaproteobacteria bacterium]